MTVKEADMDFRVPRLPHSVVKYAQSTSVRQLIQKIENHPDRHALQKDLQQNQSFNPFSSESKQMIRDVGNIELCELLETEPQTQCKVCVSYWNIDIVCYTCGHFLCEEGRISNSSIIRWTFQFRSTSPRKDDLTDIDMVRSRETGNTFRPTSWRSAKRSSSWASMTDSYEMKHFVIEWLKMVETKMFVDNGMLVQMKIIHTIWHLKNIIITRVRGGLLQRRQVPILCQWSTDLTSNKHCLPCSNWYKKEGALQTSTNSRRNQQWAESSYSWWNWQGSWWTPFSLKVTMEMKQVLTERCDLLCCFWNNSSGQKFLEFNYFVTDGSFTADSGLL